MKIGVQQYVYFHMYVLVSRKLNLTFMPFAASGKENTFVYVVAFTCLHSIMLRFYFNQAQKSKTKVKCPISFTRRTSVLKQLAKTLTIDMHSLTCNISFSCFLKIFDTRKQRSPSWRRSFCLPKIIREESLEFH